MAMKYEQEFSREILKDLTREELATSSLSEVANKTDRERDEYARAHGYENWSEMFWDHVY